MTTTSPFSANKTVLKSNVSLTERYRSLSEQAQEVLSRVAELQEEQEHESVGVYVEHDNSETKPFDTKYVKEVLRSGLVLVDSASEEEKGVEFLLLNQDVVDVMVEFGDFTSSL